MTQPQRLVTFEQVDAAIAWLRDSAADLGKAKEEAVRASHMIKVVKALEMKKHNELSAAKAEVEALASEAYQKALVEDAVAAGEYEKLRSLRDAAAIKIDAWRSEQANFRSIKI